MTSAIRFGRVLGFAALALVVCGGLNAEQGGAGEDGGRGFAGQGSDRLRDAGLDAPDRQSAGRNAAGPGCGRGGAGGTHSGTAGRISLVCQRRMRLALSARGPL